MLRILFVCTGNRCRSPFAAASLAKLTEGLSVHVESAGTADLGPVPPTADAIGVAGSMGVDVKGHRARALHLVDATQFDAVIGFERNHVATAVVDGGVPYERAFLLPEVARLLQQRPVEDGGDPVERARAALRDAHALRGTGFVPGEEVDDPIGRPLKKYQEVFTEIEQLNESILDALFPVGAAATPASAREEAAMAPQPIGTEAPTPAHFAAELLWGASEPALDEPEAEAEPAAHESPIPEATST